MSRSIAISRRRFNQLAGAAAAATSLGIGACATTPSSKGRAVVIGGGFGGATAAKYVRTLDPAIDVTLVEPAQTFYTCPFSNYVLAGFKTMNDIAHNYSALRDKHGVRVVHDTATAIDPVARTVRLAGGGTLSYDKLVVSPGIDIRWNALEGYNEAAAELMPHAWKAGPQTMLLRRQLEAMPDGGLVILTPPANPFRCPPGPYERTAMIAHYLKTAKPRSKILVLDAKDQFSKQGLFTAGWKAVYGDMIEWVPLSKDGKVVRVIPSEMTVVSEFGQRHKGAVVNVIPPQYAGQIARDSGLANQTGWCTVDPITFESTVHKNVHVIGDASIAGAMPKSGFAANSQGKVAALAIVNALNGREMAVPTFVNTCYSLIAPDYGISVADVYRLTPQGIVAAPNAGGVSPANADAAFRNAEARYAESWYASMSREIWDA
ncbi:MAG TPA: NAD(P)/FAD-dependent oxidoreductase [Alphaproteobacteria bacterium]|nr:NAD(P)/FAD-dependent oxidoreductase [Alphaproteobacteria bacterium]